MVKADAEAFYRAYLAAQLGREMDDDEYAAMRSRSEIAWIETAFASMVASARG